MHVYEVSFQVDGKHTILTINATTENNAKEIVLKQFPTSKVTSIHCKKIVEGKKKTQEK